MRRLLLSFFFLMASASLAFAQQHNGQPCYTTNGTNCIPVGTGQVSGNGPLPVTLSPSTLTISSGNITATISSSTLAPVSPATATATKSDLTGCQYNATPFAPTDGQQMAIGCDQNGRINSAGGTANQVAATPTIQAAAYSVGNCIGGFNAISVTTYNGQSGYLTNVRLSSMSATAYNLFLYIFDSQPTTSTCTDKGTLTLSATDVDKLIGQGVVTFAPPTSTITPYVASLDFTPPRPFRAGGIASSGVKTVYYGLGVATAVTPSSVSDLHLRFGVARD